VHPDHQPYWGLTSRSRLEKSINSLLGIIEGIAIDGVINDAERDFLELWLKEHEEVQDRHPFSELIPVVTSAIADQVLTEEEKEDITWLCKRLRSSEFFDLVTADMQRLHALLGGIVADGEVTERELEGLSAWLQEHEHLRTCWPYDEIDSLITAVMQDQRIDQQEHEHLKRFFAEFVAILDDRTIVSPRVNSPTGVVGLCAVCPEIEFAGSQFCFTGTSSRYNRSTLAEIASKLGGLVHPSVTKSTRYLVIGADGNPCWAYACYGRKVEKAVELRRAGSRLLLIHEHDFHDAVADLGLG
jgi:NAD-dependent DNA ligase